jgi:ABC-type transporter Mla maintaining outer membrane lipid asymmetry permease subunit MlaE
VRTPRRRREFAKLGLTRSVGGVLALALSRELTPVVTSIIVAGRVGSAFAAELGTMQVSEQTDSLRVLGSDPVDYLITPRVLACMVAGEGRPPVLPVAPAPSSQKNSRPRNTSPAHPPALSRCPPPTRAPSHPDPPHALSPCSSPRFSAGPILNLLCFCMGMAASVFLAEAVYDVPANMILDSAARAVGAWDVVTSMIKCWVFGTIISVVSCSWGYTTAGGAKGVGESTTSGARARVCGRGRAVVFHAFCSACCCRVP